MVAIACLGLGVSSFAAPLAERFRASISGEPRIAAQEQTIPSPPPRSCSAVASPSVEQDSAIAKSVAYFRVHQSGLTEPEIHRVAEVLVDCAAFYGIDPALVIAVIHVESRGNAFALSPVGAMGLMQIMPPTGEELAAELGIRWLGSKVLFEPEVNVQLGIAYLRQLRSRFGNWPTALAAYNWGPSLISRRLRTGIALPVVYSSSVLRAKRNRSGI